MHEKIFVEERKVSKEVSYLQDQDMIEMVVKRKQNES